MRKTGLYACALAIAVVEMSVRSGSANAPSRHTPSEALVLVAARDPAARTTEVRLVTLDGGTAHAATLGTITHSPGAVVRGDVLRGARAVVVAADEEGASDPDWGSALFRVDASGAHRLARGLYHASRPLAGSGGRVYVERGVSGPWPTQGEARAGRLRTDALAIDVIDPVTGDARTLYTWRGYTLHLAGESRDEIVVYRVAFEGADLIAIDRVSGRERTISPLPPFARDFSMDAKKSALVFHNRDDKDRRLWVTESVDLASGVRTRLAAQRDEAPFEGPTSASPDGAWTLAVRRASNPASRIVAAVRVSTGVMTRLASDDERVEPLGFIGQVSGGVR